MEGVVYTSTTRLHIWELDDFGIWEMYFGKLEVDYFSD